MARASKPGVIGASHRLRMVRRDFADQEECQQREYLCEELERLLKEVPFGDRRAFLQLLLEQFPGREGQVLPGGPVPPASAPRLALDQPMQLIDALVEGLGSLPDDQKKAVASRLQEVLAELQPSGETSAKSVTNARSTFQLPAEAEIHKDRFGELANLLAESVIKMEQLTVAVWGKVAGKSSLRPPKQAKKLAGQFLSEERGNPEELVKDLQLLVQFATAIMTATSRAGEEVARRYWRQLSPEAIRTVVDMEQNRLRDTLLSKDVRCWRKYCELTAELGPEHIEKEVESAMADYAEAFVRGLERLS
ncbi:MAG: hypothetical protein ABFE13_15525 [Phycisphaerales bacterium]